MPEIHTRKILRVVRKALYWVIPPVVLVYIFLKIDINTFVDAARNIELRYYLVGLAINPLVMMIGVFRWFYLKRRLVDAGIPFSFSTNNYWIGLSIGFLAPGSLGWDIYRIIAATKKYGKLIRNTFVAVFEKLSGLAAASMIIMVSFPFLDISSNEVIDRIMVAAYIVFFGLVVFILVAGLFSERFHFITQLARRVQASLLEKLRNTRFSFSQYLQEEAGENQDVNYNLKRVIPGLPVIMTSALSIQLLSSFAIFIFIRALNYDLPYYVPMFVSPVMFFIFLLPISFGSLGIREGAFIFFYGIFGMDQEAALLLSFLALSGRLLSVLIGGIVLQVSSVKKIIT
jgi:uncharacterized protein (TIRG00374 family)